MKGVEQLAERATKLLSDFSSIIFPEMKYEFNYFIEGNEIYIALKGVVYNNDIVTIHFNPKKNHINIHAITTTKVKLIGKKIDVNCWKADRPVIEAAITLLRPVFNTYKELQNECS